MERQRDGNIGHDHRGRHPTLVRFEVFDAGGHTSNWVCRPGHHSVRAVAAARARSRYTPARPALPARGRNATEKGTDTCNGAGLVTISGTITQASTGAKGNFSVTVPCPNNSTVTQAADPGPEAGGTPFRQRQRVPALELGGQRPQQQPADQRQRDNHGHAHLTHPPTYHLRSASRPGLSGGGDLPRQPDG